MSYTPERVVSFGVEYKTYLNSHHSQWRAKQAFFNAVMPVSFVVLEMEVEVECPYDTGSRISI